MSKYLTFLVPLFFTACEDTDDETNLVDLRSLGLGIS